MRILHCADVHLDSRLSSNLDQDKSRIRRAELVSSFKKMVDYARTHDIDAIIIAGDLFDTATISRSTVSMVRQCVENNPEIDFYYLNGNHDEQYMMKDVEELKNFKTFADSWTSYVLDESQNLVITGIASETTCGIADSLSLDEKALNIVVMHGQIYDNCGSEGISLAALKHKGIDYLAMGHVHRYVCESLDERGRYCYPGCLESRGFDECDEHGVVVLDIHDKTIDRTFVPWGSRNAFYLEADLSECKDTISCINVISELAKANGVKADDMLEVMLGGELNEDAEYSVDIIYQELKDNYFCLKLKDKTRLKIDYSKYVNDISLKGEFIKMVMADDSLQESDKSEIIRTGLMALAGESV